LGAGTVSLFPNNGFNGATTPTSAVQAGLGRNDRERLSEVVGHDFDNQTTWRNQFVFDDRGHQPADRSDLAIGDFLPIIT